ESVTLSNDELDNITKDLESAQEVDLSPDQENAPEAEKEIEKKPEQPQTAAESDDSVIQDTEDFEAELLRSAKVDMKKVSDEDTDTDAPQGKPAAEKESDTSGTRQTKQPEPTAADSASKKKAGAKPAKSKSLKKPVGDAEIAEVFAYFDSLLEYLPEDKIKEFAESKYYDKYISVINRLGR
ncbi:MAG TPA: hypothetical protein VKS21_07710, partial [Spirochaetota bacterium]|nr:hypothetical protein [Spirochaetota bacterium]